MDTSKDTTPSNTPPPPTDDDDDVQQQPQTQPPPLEEDEIDETPGAGNISTSTEATASTSTTTGTSGNDAIMRQRNNASSTTTGSSNANPKMMKRSVSSIHRMTKERIKADMMTNNGNNLNERHQVPHSTSTQSLRRGGGGGSSVVEQDSGNNNKSSMFRVGSLHQWVTTTDRDSDDEDSQQKKKQRRTMYQRLCNKQTLHNALPCLEWMESYKWKSSTSNNNNDSTLCTDIIAGLTVGVMIVPQSMSYAKLAGLPVEYGLYSALMPIYMYAIFGTSRQLAVGPVALISLLLATGLTKLLSSSGVTSPTEESSIEYQDEYMEVYTTLAIQMSALVGLTYIGMGILKLGFVTIFLSHSVISGFTTGAAVIIGMSQLQYFLGYSVEKSDKLHILLQRIIDSIDQFNYKTFILGISATICLIVLKYIGKTYPRFKWIRAMGPLSVTVIAIILQVIFDLESYGIPIVGTIPKGLPNLTIGRIFPLGGDLSNLVVDGATSSSTSTTNNIDIGQMFIVVISISIVGFMESIAIAKQLASKHNYEIDSSKELLGLGMSNLVGAGFFQGYPVTGSFSRSAVNNESGAKSGISGIVTATLVALVLLFLTPVFEQLPLAVLASIVISGVIGLLDYPEAIYLWKVHKFDFLSWVVACIGTLFLGVEMGLGIAVGVSLLNVLKESAYPPTSVMGRLPGTNTYRNVKQYPMAECYDGIVVVRIDAPIYFANTQHVREKIRKYEGRANEQISERRKQQRLRRRRHHQQQKLQDQGIDTSKTSIQFYEADEHFDAYDEEVGDVVVVGSEEESATESSSSSYVKYLILELSPVSHIDTSALHILHDMHKTYQAQDIQLCFCNPSPVVMERMVASGLVEQVGTDHFFVSIQDAVDHCLEEMDIQAINRRQNRISSSPDVAALTTSSANNATSAQATPIATEGQSRDDDDVENSLPKGIFMNSSRSDGSINGDIGLNMDSSEEDE